MRPWNWAVSQRHAASSETRAGRSAADFPLRDACGKPAVRFSLARHHYGHAAGMCLIESSYVDVTAWLQDGQLLETLAPQWTIPTSRP